MSAIPQSNLQERYEQFTSYFVNEFEMFIEVQRAIIEKNTSKNDKIKGIAINSVTEIYNSMQGMAGTFIGGIKNYIVDERKVDIAGKMINLINKSQKPEEKEAMREMLVHVAYELFRSYEHQFMCSDKSQGGWSQAMLHLARAAVWSFMHYYRFKPQDELTEQYILEAITLKNMPNLSTWKKWYYRDEKKFSKVTNAEVQNKCDGVKLFAKVGIVLNESCKPIYYKNDSTNPEKYGYRRIFTHENSENIQKEFEKYTTQQQKNYQYKLDMEFGTKIKMCEKMLYDLNLRDDSLSADNIKRIMENIVENLMCEMMEQIVTAINGIGTPGATSSSIVIHKTNSNQDFAGQTQNADAITNVNKSTFSAPVTFNASARPK